MRLLVVGSGDAFNSSGRNHSCYWLEDAGRAPFMVDFGATALAGLKRLGRDPRRLAGVALTHLHGDHTGGMPFLFLDGMYSLVRNDPLELLGPFGFKERIDEVYHAAYSELVDRPKPYRVSCRTLLPGEEAELLGAQVRGFAAEHMDPPDRPLCLRIQGQDGKVVAFSGDTTMCEGLVQAARGADLLIAECTALRPPAGRHCTWEDWLQAFPRFDARRIVLSHLGHDVRAELPALRRAAPPNVDFADDGLLLEI
jgi:ribonuclease BN (tRNA processing enzyme)